ncbi:MAG: hypothetical protein HOB40_00505 [Candidatus Marinimicrobia bacterium]|jgi:hypothetical protein|nr:hypothetical protein [Candidatus Neomarinimicrobiota bacterium]MBT3998654.1 hypothetical protein [Candidatus Neomarinimicrobiota bacterium]MBT4282886.1 hypothetical protein [Candidatus Neomarinimicrobiota bacterium]MBT4578481.1 hypothetical protein [Candidatus Neomarinimicrobiota bacterium]MBT4957614.1 hypothetical protein [Candidatus Neomarinimicrobiota bacterium]
MMIRLFIFILFTSTHLLAQPKDAIEFQLNTISGFLTHSLNNEFIENAKIEIVSGNGIVKDSTFTDSEGKFSISDVGFMWKPKLRISSRDFLPSSISLKMSQLDEKNNILIHQKLVPISENQKIPILAQNAIEERAQVFFIKGNVFYYLSTKNNVHSAERIIIQTKKATDNGNGIIVLNINGTYYDPVRCYVPQMGNYENLANIIDAYFPSSLFKPSGLPLYLSDSLLKPSIIFGTVMDANSKKGVMGAEVMLAGTLNRRVTDENGKYAFQISDDGIYQILVSPPFGYHSSQAGLSDIIVKSAWGGWHQSNHYLNP